MKEKIKKAIYENQPPTDLNRLTNSRQRKVIGGLAAGVTLVSVLAGIAGDRSAQHIAREDRIEATAATKASPSAQLAQVLQSAEKGKTIYAAKGEFAFVNKTNNESTSGSNETVYDPIAFKTTTEDGNKENTIWHVAYFTDNTPSSYLKDGDTISELIDTHQIQIQTLAQPLGGHELIPLGMNENGALVELASDGSQTDIVAAITTS